MDEQGDPAPAPNTDLVADDDDPGAKIVAELMKFGATPDDPRVQRLRELMTVELTRGPIPSAQQMAAYSKVDSELPDRILKDAQMRRDQRHALEEMGTRAEIARTTRSQRLAFFVAIAAILAAIGVDYLTGNTWLAMTLVVVGIGGPSTATVIARRMDRVA